MSSGSQDDAVEITDDDIEALGIQAEDFGDSNLQIGQDDDEAINKSNVLKRGDVLRRANLRTGNAHRQRQGEGDLAEEAE